jgi:hypothetical protein
MQCTDRGEKGTVLDSSRRTKPFLCPNNKLYIGLKTLIITEVVMKKSVI